MKPVEGAAERQAQAAKLHAASAAQLKERAYGW